MHGPELVHALRHIPDLKNNPSSFKTNDRIQSYAQKTDFEGTNSFNSKARPDHPPPILLSEESSINRSIPALRVMYTV